MEAGDDVPLRIGVLELQGDFAEHTAMLRSLRVTPVPLRSAKDIDSSLDGVILPGGESTTIGKQMHDSHMLEPLSKLVSDGVPCFGTCAGCILMARRLPGYESIPRLACMELSVTRNAYGPQVESFEAPVTSELWRGDVLRAVNIRAPRIDDVGADVKVLAKFKDSPVLVREGSNLACTFHPELTDDTRVHELFLRLVRTATRKAP